MLYGFSKKRSGNHHLKNRIGPMHKFAVIGFEVDNSVDIVETSKIVSDDKTLEKGQSVHVPYKTKKGHDSYFPGNVISLHESYDKASAALDEVLNEEETTNIDSPSVLGRGKRVKRKKTFDSGDDEEENKPVGKVVGLNPEVDKILKDKGELCNLNKIKHLKKKSKVSPKVPSSLFESDDDDDDDELIEKRSLVKLQKKYDQLKKTTVPIEKFNKLTKKNEALNKEIKKLQDLNYKLQEEVIAKFSKGGPIRSLKFSTPNSTTSKESRPASPMMKYNEDTIKIVNQQEEPLAEQLHFFDKEEMDLKTPESLSGLNSSVAPEATINSAQKDVEISQEKVILAKSQVKPGRLGDSQFAKNLATILWEPNVLENRSVTGKSSNAVKGVPAKPKLTPQKMDQLKKIFIERMREEMPPPSENEVALRCSSLNTYISQKIATLNRIKK